MRDDDHRDQNDDHDNKNDDDKENEEAPPGEDQYK